eukprot:8658355-Lingulodinium_polyedra.AAC.1
MVHSPFGHEIVSPEGLYLGAWLASPARGPPPWHTAPYWSCQSTKCIAYGTWKRTVSTTHCRGAHRRRHSTSLLLCRARHALELTLHLH